MHNHFDKNLNLQKIIMDKKPKVIVECGAASGENTRQIISMKSIYSFKLFTISDSPYAEETIKVGEYLRNGFKWVYGLSYKELSKFDDDSIDLCIIDTDHNYWTLNEELSALHDKLRIGGVIALHDTQTYRKNSGQAFRYGTGDPYPGELITRYEKEGKGMGDALWEFLAKHQNYLVLRHVAESHGAIALEKVNA